MELFLFTLLFFFLFVVVIFERPLCFKQTITVCPENLEKKRQKNLPGKIAFFVSPQNNNFIIFPRNLSMENFLQFFSFVVYSACVCVLSSLSFSLPLLPLPCILAIVSVHKLSYFK